MAGVGDGATIDEADRPLGLEEPQTAEPATHSVLASLREMIVTGEIAPNTRLRAEALATRLQVSRTPVRSALAVLSAEGLVTYGMNRGYTVRAVTVADILDAIEVRAGLQGLAARNSVELGWEPQALAALAGNVAESRGIVESGAWSEEIERQWYELNWRFHRMITHAARNAVLRNTIRMTVIYPVFGDLARTCPAVAAAVPQRFRQLSETTPEYIRAALADHEAILTAIEAQDAAAAEAAMIQHVLATKVRLHAIATRR